MSATSLDSYTNCIRHIPKKPPWGVLDIPTTRDLRYWHIRLLNDAHLTVHMLQAKFYWNGYSWEMFDDRHGQKTYATNYVPVVPDNVHKYYADTCAGVPRSTLSGE